jgi:hypothetical protein
MARLAYEWFCVLRLFSWSEKLIEQIVIRFFRIGEFLGWRTSGIEVPLIFVPGAMRDLVVLLVFERCRGKNNQLLPTQKRALVMGLEVWIQG